MLGTFLTNVPLSTANFLSYLMLVIVAIFLLSGPAITYYYWKRNRRMKTAPSATSEKPPH